ncbi:MAG: integrase, partial [Nitrospira sp. WS110]|nr:integrase [Nitrospira sp. WS110]
TVQKLGRWKTISMVMRYAHHHPESLRAGIEILDRLPAGVSTVLAQSAPSAVQQGERESVVSC